MKLALIIVGCGVVALVVGVVAGYVYLTVKSNR